MKPLVASEAAVRICPAGPASRPTTRSESAVPAVQTVRLPETKSPNAEALPGADRTARTRLRREQKPPGLSFSRGPGVYSAANRGRTGTRSLPRDFKSLVSANSTIAAQKPPRWVCAAATIILDLPDFVNRWAEADSPARLRPCRRGARHTSGYGTRPPPGSC